MQKEIKVAMVQTYLIWESPEENRKHLAKKISSIKSDVDVIILPEMFTSGFTMTPENLKAEEGENTLIWMKKLAKDKGAALVGSIVYKVGKDFVNRLFFVEPNGGCHFYDKRHTFTLAGEHKVYAAGSERLIFTFRGFRVRPLICYDLRFPVWSRNQDNYDILLYVANWPKPRITAWDSLLKARAIENMSYCLGVNRIGEDANGHVYSGHSSAYDSLGIQMAYSEEDEILYASLSKQRLIENRNKLKFLDDMDEFEIKD